MRKLPIIAALVAAVSVANAAPADATKHSPDTDDIHVTVSASRGRLGIGVLQISSALRTHFNAPADRGVLVDGVRPNSPAAKAGLQTGDVIVEVDGTAARTVGDVVGALDKHKKGDVASIVAIRGTARLTMLPRLDSDPMPMMREWFGTGDSERGWHWFEPSKLLDDQDMKSSLEDAQKRMDALERRLQRLEHT